MNGPQHYRAAEQILQNLQKETTRLAAQSDMGLAEEQGFLQAADTTLQMAQLHATLALTASNIATDREQFDAWREATEVPTTTSDDAPLTAKVVRNCLSLVEDEIPRGHAPDVDEITSWSDQTRRSVVDWAMAHHLLASDNDVEIPVVPDVLMDSGGDPS